MAWRGYLPCTALPCTARALGLLTLRCPVTFMLCTMQQCCFWRRLVAHGTRTCRPLLHPTESHSKLTIGMFYRQCTCHDWWP